MPKSLLIKSAKILKYGPGIYKQLLFGSTNYILCSIYGTVQDCKDILPIQIPLHCPAKSTSIVLFSYYDGTVPPNLLLLFYFPITTVLCRIADFRTQACNVTLNQALVLYLSKLPVDAAIHALIYRPVNR